MTEAQVPTVARDSFPPMERRLVIVGAGPIGSAAAQAAVADGAASSIFAVVDPDPDARESLRAEFDCPGYASVADLPEGRPGDVALAAFTSRAEEVAGEIVRLVSLNYHVVTTCEELAWPKRHMRDALDSSARAGGRVIIATGANPGFVMDRLPLAAATACRSITSIRIERRVNTAERREQLVAKTGRGLTREEFARGVAEGSVGHVGLEASAKLVAAGLGLPTHEVTESISPVVGDDDIVVGLDQRAVMKTGSGPDIVLELVMAWDLEDAGDTIDIEGDPPVHLHVRGGYHGDRGTIAHVVHAVALCDALEPGFFRPFDLPLREP